MESKLSRFKSILFPRYFKGIGLLVMVVALGFPAIVKSMHLGLDLDFLKPLFSNAFMLGLFFFAFSRDKVEDEMTLDIRLKAMAWAFATGVEIVILIPLVDVIFKEPIRVLNAQMVMTAMLVAYVVMYYLIKKVR